MSDVIANQSSDASGQAPLVRSRWRWLFAGMYRTGVMLIWLAVLVFGFAGWQLWGTGLHTARAQDDLGAEFAELSNVLDESPAVVTSVSTSVPQSTTDAPVTSTTVGEVPATVPPATVPPATVGVPETSVVTVTESTVVPERPTSASNWFKVATGDPLARIEIPRIGVDAYVIAGVTKEALRDGPGHYPGSVLPGQNGNSVIAGHRTTYGAVFGDVDVLAPGDQIVVTIPTGDRYTYTVTGSEVVSPEEAGRVMGWTPGAELTLLTCTPKYTAQSRLIIHASLNAGESSVLWEAPPNPITQYTDHTFTETIELDEPELVPVEVVDEVTGEVVTVDVPAAAAEDVRVVDGEVIVPDDVGSGDGEVVVDEDLTSGFDDGWFTDRAAIVPALLWLAGFAAVVICARLVAFRPLRRRFGRTAARTVLLASAVVVVASPAAVWCLWWMYTNVARLLPGSV